MEHPAHVLVETLEQFKEDWASTICPNCGAEKWKNSPFCRHCSIRLQRKNLIGGIKDWIGHSMEANFQFFLRQGDDVEAVYAWTMWYDRCRDYLKVTERERVA